MRSWKMAELFDFSKLNLDAIKTLIYPILTLYQILLDITYHISYLKSDVMSRRRIVRAPVSLQDKTTVTSSRGHAVAIHHNTMMRGRVSRLLTLVTMDLRPQSMLFTSFVPSVNTSLSFIISAYYSPFTLHSSLSSMILLLEPAQ